MMTALSATPRFAGTTFMLTKNVEQRQQILTQLKAAFGASPSLWVDETDHTGEEASRAGISFSRTEGDGRQWVQVNDWSHNPVSQNKLYSAIETDIFNWASAGHWGTSPAPQTTEPEVIPCIQTPFTLPNIPVGRDMINGLILAAQRVRSQDVGSTIHSVFHQEAEPLELIKDRITDTGNTKLADQFIGMGNAYDFLVGYALGLHGFAPGMHPTMRTNFAQLPTPKPGERQVNLIV